MYFLSPWLRLKLEVEDLKLENQFKEGRRQGNYFNGLS